MTHRQGIRSSVSSRCSVRWRAELPLAIALGTIAALLALESPALAQRIQRTISQPPIKLSMRRPVEAAAALPTNWLDYTATSRSSSPADA